MTFTVGWAFHEFRSQYGTSSSGILKRFVHDLDGRGQGGVIVEERERRGGSVVHVHSQNTLLGDVRPEGFILKHCHRSWRRDVIAVGHYRAPLGKDTERAETEMTKNKHSV